MIFIDANVFMYAAGADSPRRDPCRRILTAAVRSGLQAVTNTELLQEIPYRYHRVGAASVALERAREAAAVVGAVPPVEAVLPVEEEDVRAPRHGPAGPPCWIWRP